MSKKKISLTKVRKEALELLNEGEIMEIDSNNLACIGMMDVAPVTRYFLTGNRLVTRKEKSRAVTTAGNGYIITPKGITLLGS